jgi:hypothetical protein
MSPCTGKDANGRMQYDRNGQLTTINYDGAFALYETIKDIISEKINECNLSIPCNGANLILTRQLGNNGIETILTLNKANASIPFKFGTQQIQIKENGQFVTKQIESQLGAFGKILEGYLTGINADRHLDKLTDDYVKSINSSNQQQDGQQQFQSNNYNNNFTKPNGNYKYKNNNYRNNNGGNNWNKNAQQQSMSTYQLS